MRTVFPCTVFPGLLVAFALFGCGKFGPPLPPEMLSPRAVRSLVVSGIAAGVKLSWESPEADLRAKELKSMNAYLVCRKQLDGKADALDQEVPFKTIANINDGHIIERDRLRQEARLAGKPSHRVKVDPAMLKFEYLDKDVKLGSSYLYQIVPVNQGDVEGEIRQTARVLFKAESTEIDILEDANVPADAVIGEEGL